MSSSESFRQQARAAEDQARHTTFGPERICLAQEAKSLHQAADQAEREEAAPPPPPGPARNG